MNFSTPTIVLLIVIGLPVICGTIIALVTIMKGSSAIDSKRLDTEETQLLQEIHQGLAKMEKRIDSLETLVIENDKPTTKESSNFS